MKAAFSLIEVLVFITILSLFLIIAAAIITISLRQNTLKINMLKATHYNQQLLDWIQAEREADWNVFVAQADDVGKTYCFTTTPLAWSISSCDFDLENMFKRTALLKSIGTPPTQIQVTIQTDWEEVGNPYSTQLHRIFTLWE